MSKKIILASSSPRRKELLTLVDVQFEIKIPDVNEDLVKGEKPEAMVKRLSYEKAQAVLEMLKSDRSSTLILAADTTVVSFKNEILGKPQSLKEGLKMIADLQGRSHWVYTGYSVLKVVKGVLKAKVTRSVKTKVFIRKLSAHEIRAYLHKGESMDKAGGYAAQGFGMGLIEKIEGSYTNVVGLPVAEVLTDLKKLGWKI